MAPRADAVVAAVVALFGANLPTRLRARVLAVQAMIGVARLSNTPRFIIGSPFT